MEDKFSPTRYIFDEGHNVFDAADSAFAAALTAGETAELRRWVRGAEDGRRGRARGLEKRLAELISGDESALAALDEASEAARILPGTGWRKRLNEASPAGPAEVFSLQSERLSIHAFPAQTACMICKRSCIQHLKQLSKLG